MAKVTLTDLTSLANDTSAVNSLNVNFQTLEDYINNNVLSRDTGVEVNTLQNDIDLNSYDLNNVTNLNGFSITDITTGLTNQVTYATEWANKAEDTLVSAAAGGDQVDDYSSLHHAAKASASESNASTSASNASTSESNASTSESNASTSASNAATSESNAATSEANAEAWAAIVDPTKIVSQDSQTGAADIPAGTTAQRPVGAAGEFRFNSDTGSFEGYDGAVWGAIGGGGGSSLSITEVQTGALSASDAWLADSSTTRTRDLPITPTTDDEVLVKDNGGLAATNNITIGRNGETIQGAAEDFVIDVNNGMVHLKYTGTDWRVIS